MSKLMKALVFGCAALIVMAVPVFAGDHIATVAAPEPTTIMMLVGGIGSVVGLRYYKLRKR
jgi:PEP-CTERM motif